MEPATNPTIFIAIVAVIAALTIMVLIAFGIYMLQKRAARKGSGPADQPEKAHPSAGLPAYWRELRQEVEASNRVINRTVFEQIRQVFLDHYTGTETPEVITREYAADEFLMVVDMDGKPSRPTPIMMDQYHDLINRHPVFKRWFREDTLREGEHTGDPVLLAARWLCHLAGLRHGTVEIFIDPPGSTDQTYVQVRGMHKFEAPGAFDIPCAGHVDGTDGYEESLRKELGEELNLTLEDLEDLCLVERYNSFSDEHEDAPINNEHRVLYRARLKPEAVARIRFVDGEVAGLSIFSVPELRELIKRYPDRVASGLSDAIGYYGRKGTQGRKVTE